MMNSDEQTELNSFGRHPPLCRAGAQNPNHTMIFLTSSAPTTTSTLSSSLSMPVLESSPDSCYSSCSEIGSHPALSREASDNTSLSNAFSTRCSINSTTNDHTEFATKLGYSAENIELVLQNLGPNAGQDQVLSELIKLGKSPKQKAQQSASRTKSNQWPTTPTLVLNQDTDLKPKLRPIVIDGSNLAMHHGRKEFFSCRGIRECVDFFVERGHEEIYVFVPQYRRETSRADCPVYDQHILFELENEQRLVWTPSRYVNGRRIVCHDDRYILKTAADKDAVIVSNDVYRDLIREHPEYKQLVAQRLLMYSFVDGKFMPPEDPLGKRGPKLDKFLQTGPPFTMQPCPYALKCTYGNKCKYYHPERLNGVHVSTTDRLLNKSESKKQSLSARPSMIYEQRVDPMGLKPNNSHDKVTRTHSLNFQLDPSANNQTFYNFNRPSNDLLQPNPIATNSHQLLNRHISAPLNNQLQLPGIVDQMSGNQLASVSNTTLNQQSYNEEVGRPFSANDGQFQMFAPSKSVWGNSEYSLSPFVPTSIPTTSESNNPNSTQSLMEARERLRYNLSQIFPETSVLAVLNAHPNELNAQKLCQRLLAFQNGFNN